MKYVGSKNKLSKELIPIINTYLNNHSYSAYIEPFVGGANLIDKVDFPRKIGCDIHKELIALLKFIQIPEHIDLLPPTISEKEYFNTRDHKELYPSWYVGLVGFCATFGAKYFGGYARGEGRDIPNEAIRNLVKQAPSLTNIEFKHCSYLDLNPSSSLIYCDPPYSGTLRYKTDKFDYNEFYQWCRDMSRNNTILVSEYWMPPDFKKIYSKECKVMIDSNKTEGQIRVERLYTI